MRRKNTLLMVPAVSVALVAVAVAGCGGNSNDNVKASAPTASAKVSTPSGGKATVGVQHREPRQVPGRLAGPHALSVREGHGHDEHLLRRLRERLAALHDERPTRRRARA